MKWDRDVDMVVYVFDDRIEVWSKKSLRKHWWWRDKVNKDICKYVRTYYVCRPSDRMEFIAKHIEFMYRHNLSGRIIDAKTNEVVYVI